MRYLCEELDTLKAENVALKQKVAELEEGHIDWLKHFNRAERAERRVAELESRIAGGVEIELYCYAWDNGRAGIRTYSTGSETVEFNGNPFNLRPESMATEPEKYRRKAHIVLEDK